MMIETGRQASTGGIAGAPAMESMPPSAWRDAVVELVAPARSPRASVWERSTAVRELERALLPRFRADRARLDALAARLDSRMHERLWAAGELLELLYDALAQDVRMPLRGLPFAAELDAMVRALDHWCDEAALAERLARRG